VRRIVRFISKLAAGAGVLLLAGGAAASGLTVMLAGIVVAQQTLSRLFGADLRLGDGFVLAGRALGMLGRATGARRPAPAS